jgi:hypothetical protein
VPDGGPIRSRAPGTAPAPAGSTTSSGAAGALPATNRYGVRAALDQPWPRHGRYASVCSGTATGNRRSATTDPTPGTAATRATRSAGNGGASVRVNRYPSAVRRCGSAWTTRSARANRREGPDPAALAALIAAPAVVTSATPAASASSDPVNDTQRARTVARARRISMAQMLGADCDS